MKINEFKAWIEGFRSVGKIPDIEQWTEICEMIEEIEEEVPIVIPHHTYPYPVLPHWIPYQQPYWPYHIISGDVVPLTTNAPATVTLPFTISTSPCTTSKITAIYNEGVEGAGGMSCPGAIGHEYTHQENNWSYT